MKELEDTEKTTKSFKVQLRSQLKKYWKYSRKWFPFSIIIGLVSGVLMGLFIASIVQLWNLVDKINYYYALFPIVGGITSLLLYFGFKEVKGAGISYVLTHKNTTTPIPSRISAIDFQQGFAKDYKYVRNVMSKDVIVAYPDDTLSSVFDKLTDNRIECMPVVDIDNPTKVIGFVTFRDIENRYETAMTKLHSQQSLTIEELISDDI